MTPTEQQIRLLLERKEEIIQKLKMQDATTGSFTGNHRWLMHAVELLLRHQLELREELRNSGILR